MALLVLLLLALLMALPLLLGLPLTPVPALVLLQLLPPLLLSRLACQNARSRPPPSPLPLSRLPPQPRPLLRPRPRPSSGMVQVRAPTVAWAI
jgi:hypothetical protein